MRNAEFVEEIVDREIPPDLWSAAGGAETQLGTGGMITKLQAADLARRSGRHASSPRGRNPTY